MSGLNLFNTPRATKIICRVVWVLVLTFELLLGGLVIAFMGISWPDEFTLVPFGLSGLLVLLAAPIALYIRGAFHKAGWQGDAVTPSSYQTGFFSAMLILNGAVMIPLCFAWIDGAALPYAIPATVVIVIQILMWPNGKAMQAQDDTDSSGGGGG